MKLPVDFRLLKERYLGEASRRPWIAENRLAEIIPYLQPDAAETARIHAALLLHYAGLDKRKNAGIPAFRDALEKNGKAF